MNVSADSKKIIFSIVFASIITLSGNCWGHDMSINVPQKNSQTFTDSYGAWKTSVQDFIICERNIYSDFSATWVAKIDGRSVATGSCDGRQVDTSFGENKGTLTFIVTGQASSLESVRYSGTIEWGYEGSAASTLWPFYMILKGTGATASVPDLILLPETTINKETKTVEGFKISGPENAYLELQSDNSCDKNEHTGCISLKTADGSKVVPVKYTSADLKTMTNGNLALHSNSDITFSMTPSAVGQYEGSMTVYLKYE